MDTPNQLLKDCIDIIEPPQCDDPQIIVAHLNQHIDKIVKALTEVRGNINQRVKNVEKPVYDKEQGCVVNTQDYDEFRDYMLEQLGLDE